MLTYKRIADQHGDEHYAVFAGETCIGTAVYNPRVIQWRAFAHGKHRYFGSRVGAGNWLRRMVRKA